MLDRRPATNYSVDTLESKRAPLLAETGLNSSLRRTGLSQDFQAGLASQLLEIEKAEKMRSDLEKRQRQQTKDLKKVLVEGWPGDPP